MNNITEKIYLSRDYTASDLGSSLACDHQK